MTVTSRFAYKAKPKQCFGLAEQRVCLPLEKKPTYTSVKFVKVCEFCAGQIASLKNNAIYARARSGNGHGPKPS